MYLYKPKHITLRLHRSSALQGEEWRCIAGYAFQIFGKSKNTLEVLARRRAGQLEFSLDVTVEGRTLRGKWGEVPGEEHPRNYMIRMPKKDKHVKLQISYDWREREYNADYEYANGKTPGKINVKDGSVWYGEIGHIEVQFFHYWPIARRLFIPLPYRRMVEENWY